MSIIQQVRAASAQWLENFNNENYQACVEAYELNASMSVYPHGKFVGREAIGQFWTSFIEQAQPKDLQYRNVKVYVENDTRAVLTATWSMNVGAGFIAKELWTKSNDGVWRLAEDDFSIVSQHDVAREKNDPADTALIIVDLQEDYFEGGKMALQNTALAAENALQLLKHFRKSQQSVIHIQHIFADDSAGFFAPDDAGSDIHPTLIPADGEELVLKSEVNSFKGTSLETVLINKGIKNLVICGAMAQMCIDAIVRHAADAGYQCTVVEDACAAPNISRQGVDISGEQVQQAMMAALEFAYADVVDTASYLSA